MLAVGPMYLAISAATPFNNLMILFYTLHHVVPLLKRHFSLTRMASPLKVLILGVPILSAAAS